MNAALYQRLEKADGKWFFDIVRVDVAQGEVLVLGRLSMSGSHRTAFGLSRTEGRSLADAANAAADSALEQAAGLLGVRVQQEAPQPRPANDHGNGSTPTPERLTSKQLAAIHAVCRRKNIVQGELADMIAQRMGKTAPQFLTKKEASALLDELSADVASR